MQGCYLLVQTCGAKKRLERSRLEINLRYLYRSPVSTPNGKRLDASTPFAILSMMRFNISIECQHVRYFHRVVRREHRWIDCDHLRSHRISCQPWRTSIVAIWNQSRESLHLKSPAQPIVHLYLHPAESRVIPWFYARSWYVKSYHADISRRQSRKILIYLSSSLTRNTRLVF